MANESNFSVAGYVATEPFRGATPSGVATLSMRLAWTPRRLDRDTGLWIDEPSSFANVKCFRRLAENAQLSLRKGDPVVVRGSLRIREYEAKDGSKRTAVDVIASSIGHDLSRGVASFRRLRAPAEPSATTGEGDETSMAGLNDHGLNDHELGDSERGEAERGETAREDMAAAEEMIDDVADVTAGEPAAAPF
jgi:single-strand DNA-binding protein